MVKNDILLRRTNIKKKKKKNFFFQVSSMIGNLRNMASDMSGELENQNSQLDRINVKAASDITRVKMANDKAAALMK